MTAVFRAGGSARAAGTKGGVLDVSTTACGEGLAASLLSVCFSGAGANALRVACFPSFWRGSACASPDPDDSVDTRACSFVPPARWSGTAAGLRGSDSLVARVGSGAAGSAFTVLSITFRSGARSRREPCDDDVAASFSAVGSTGAEVRKRIFSTVSSDAVGSTSGRSGTAFGATGDSGAGDCVVIVESGISLAGTG